MKIKAFNSQTCVELLCFAIFGVTLLYLVISDAYLSYVTPRMKPYLYFTAAVMFIWCAVSASRLFHPWPRKRAAHCYVLIIPVLLLLLPHGSITSANLSARPVGGGIGLSPGISSSLDSSSSTASSSGSSASSDASSDGSSSTGSPDGAPLDGASSGSLPSDVSSSSNALTAGDPSINASPNSTPAGGTPSSSAPSGSTPSSNFPSESPSDNTPTAGAASGENTDSKVYTSVDSFGTTVTLHGYDAKHKKIVVSNDEYYPWISELFTKLDDFMGYEVTITGSVYHDPEYMAKNEFVPARLLMSCCAADLTPCGLVCNYAEAGELKGGEWITVTGTLFRGQYMGSEEPQIKVKSIAPADPVNNYIYPF